MAELIHVTSSGFGYLFPQREKNELPFSSFFPQVCLCGKAEHPGLEAGLWDGGSVIAGARPSFFPLLCLLLTMAT